MLAAFFTADSHCVPEGWEKLVRTEEVKDLRVEVLNLWTRAVSWQYAGRTTHLRLLWCDTPAVPSCLFWIPLQVAHHSKPTLMLQPSPSFLPSIKPGVEGALGTELGQSSRYWTRVGTGEAHSWGTTAIGGQLGGAGRSFLPDADQLEDSEEDLRKMELGLEAVRGGVFHNWLVY